MMKIPGYALREAAALSSHGVILLRGERDALYTHMDMKRERKRRAAVGGTFRPSVVRVRLSRQRRTVVSLLSSMTSVLRKIRRVGLRTSFCIVS